MSELLDILNAHQELLRQAIAEGLERADCRALPKIRSGESSFLLETLAACADGADEVPVQQWLQFLRPETGSAPVPTEEVLAGLSALEAAVECALEAIQIHGGYGYVREYLVERYLRDAKITEIYEGTSEIQKMVISRSLLDESYK